MNSSDGDRKPCIALEVLVEGETKMTLEGREVVEWLLKGKKTVLPFMYYKFL